MHRNKVTIHDIARVLKIDSSTVSRALNDSPRVTVKTKKRILDKAEEMGYQRNALASNLRKSKTNTLGVIVPRISRHFFSSAIAGIEEAAYEAGYRVIIGQSLESLDRETNLVDTFVANRVDGIMMSISMETGNYQHLSSAEKSRTPIVFFDRHCAISGNNNVLIDDFQGGFTATSHLIDMGCKNIFHIGGPRRLKLYEDRYSGFRKAMEQNGLFSGTVSAVESRLMEEDGYRETKMVLDSGSGIDGIFCANDLAASGVLRCLKDRGIEIPWEIAVVGFSNEPISAVMEPSLTTLDQSGEQIGRMATDLLMKQLDPNAGELAPETIIIKPKLIVRDSSRRSDIQPDIESGSDPDRESDLEPKTE